MVSRYVAERVDTGSGGRDGMSEVVRDTLTAEFGCPDLLQSLIRVSGAGEPHQTDDREEVMFILTGTGTLALGGRTLELRPQCGVYLPPGCSYRFATGFGASPMEFVRIRVAQGAAAHTAVGTAHVRALEDCEGGSATGGRDFRVLADASTGFAAGTMFIGNVPAGPPAPVHYHTYDEVIYVLAGEGVLHIDGEHHAVARGSCYHLPPRVLHQVENTGTTTLQELGVFIPSGSPAAAYLPDGTSAYPGQPDDPQGSTGQG